MIDLDRLVEIGYYSAVVRGLMQSAEIIEATLPLIPPGMHVVGLSPSEVSKRSALESESSFLDELAGPRPDPRASGADERLLVSNPPARGAMEGLLYVYVGSALGGRELLRIARTAPWWRHEREHLLLRPYGHHLKDRWRAVLNVIECLDLEQTNAAVESARAGFDLHHRSLLDHLSGG